MVTLRFAGALFLAVLIAPSSNSASEAKPTMAPVHLPRLTPGEPYSRARIALIGRGWRPVKTNARLDDGTLRKTLGDAGAMLEAGYVETFDCSGSGLAYCIFIWKRGTKCVHVITQGEFLPEFDSPRFYSIASGDCAGSP